MKTVLIVGVILALSNLIASGRLGLGDAEALYYCYGQNLSLSYLDHPPLVGWLNFIATWIGGPSVVAVRSVSLIMSLLSLLFTVLLARDLFGKSAGTWAALLLLGTPVFTIGLIGTTPDAPLAAIWPLFTWQLARAVRDDRPGPWPRIGRPLLLGLLLGLAFLSKYTGAGLALGTLWVAIGTGGGIWLRRPGFWLGGMVAVATASPVLIWNVQHDWAGALHRLVWTQTGAGFSLRNLGALAGGQLIYVGPPMIALLGIAAVGLFRNRRRDSGQLVLLACALPTLAATYGLVLWSSVAEPHWPGIGYMPLFVAAAGAVTIGTPRLRRLAQWAVGFGVVLLITAHVLVGSPLLPMVTPEENYRPEYDLGNELRGWPEVARMIRAIDKDRRPVLAAFYTQCSQLTFVLNRPDDPPVRCVSPETDDFDIWHGPFKLPEQGALFVTDNRFNHEPALLLPGAAVPDPITVEITRGGRWVRRFKIYALTPAAPNRTPQ